MCTYEISVNIHKSKYAHWNISIKGENKVLGGLNEMTISHATSFFEIFEIWKKVLNFQKIMRLGLFIRKYNYKTKLHILEIKLTDKKPKIVFEMYLSTPPFHIHFNFRKKQNREKFSWFLGEILFIIRQRMQFVRFNITFNCWN